MERLTNWKTYEALHVGKEKLVMGSREFISEQDARESEKMPACHLTPRTLLLKTN